MLPKKTTLRLLGAALAVCLLAPASHAQTPGNAPRFTLSGYVTQEANGETVIGAAVALFPLSPNSTQQPAGAYTNAYGFYSVTVPADSYRVVISYIGFQKRIYAIDLTQGNVELNPTLLGEDVEVDEVIITAEDELENITSLDLGRNDLSIQTIRELPALLGEVDVIKAIQLLPGIQFAGEGGSGFFVRGGNFDQNLIQLDEAPVYNSSHLLGFFSVFNPDAIKDIEVYKAGFPAQYGGRLSSVVDIRMKEGNNERLGFRAGIGLLASRATLEGPIQQGKSSFIISGRRTYADAFLALSSDPDVRENTLYFYDFNAKANFQLSQRDRLYVSGYLGRDVFKFGDFFGFDWGNITATARWNHLFSDKLFSNLTFIYSDFDYAIRFSVSDDSGAEIDAGIRDLGLKADFSAFFNSTLTMHFGGSGTLHRFETGSLTPTGEVAFFTPFSLQPQDALETAAYVDIEQQLTDRLALRYGVRASWFGQYGPGTVFEYDPRDIDDPTIGSPEPIDSTRYERGQLIQDYFGLEPRLALRYRLNGSSSLKASYDRTFQYIHIASNATASQPTDLWLPSSASVQPQRADQWSLGYYRNFNDNTYITSLEAYYKDFDNQLDLKDGADILLNDRLETQLRQGDAWSYGAELYIQKAKGDLTGWLSYTLSWTRRRIPGIRNGEEYPAKNDRRHNISIVGNYKLNQRWTFGATWVYLTGNAVTVPNGKYTYQGRQVRLFGERNDYRLPAYHRMDISATLRGKNYEQARWKKEWVFSVYNAYFRKNVYFLDFRPVEDEPTQTEAVKIYLFGIVPSVTFNITF